MPDNDRAAGWASSGAIPTRSLVGEALPAVPLASWGVSGESSPSSRLIESAVPRSDFSERHSRVIAASSERVWEALTDLRVGDLPMTRVLMRLRAGGRNLLGPPEANALAALPPREVARREPKEVLLGLWLPVRRHARKGVTDVEQMRPRSLDELAATCPPGWARVGMDFHLVPLADTTRLESETRIAVPDRRTRRVFAAYWYAIRAGSGLIRREILHAVARKAERP